MRRWIRMITKLGNRLQRERGLRQRYSLVVDALFYSSNVSKQNNICSPAKSVTQKCQPEFNVKQLLRVIQGHAFEDHRKAVEGLRILYIYPGYPV